MREIATKKGKKYLESYKYLVAFWVMDVGIWEDFVTFNLS